MRFLTFTSLFPNKAEPYHGVFVQQRVAHLARRPGNSVRVVAPVPYLPPWVGGWRRRRFGQVPAQEEFEGLPVWHPRYFLLPKVSMSSHGLWMFLGSLLLVRRLVKAAPVDCIDAHYVYPDAFAAVLLGKFLGVPVIVSARGTDINLFPHFGMIRWMIRWTLQHAAGIIAVSKSLKEAMVELGAPSEKICVIGNGVDTERFQPLERAAARGHLGLSEEGKAIVSVGSLIPTKGHHRVISALAELAQVFPRLSLYILGEGPYRSQLEALVREKGLGTRVFLLGVRPNEELIYWYSAADVTCLASEREGMPNVVLESLACGTPVVATRVGGVPEAVVSPDLGVLVQSDGGDLTSGLEMALNRHWDRSVIVRQAQGRTWELVAEEVERFITLSISQHPQ